jgi:hypothetical protein
MQMAFTSGRCLQTGKLIEPMFAPISTNTPPGGNFCMISSMVFLFEHTININIKTNIIYDIGDFKRTATSSLHQYIFYTVNPVPRKILPAVAFPIKD